MSAPPPPPPPEYGAPPLAQPMSVQAHIQAQIQLQAAHMQQAQQAQAQMLQAAQFQAQLQAQQAHMRAFMQPPGPPLRPPPRPVKGAGKMGTGPRPLSVAQRQIREGDFQVQRLAGQKASEQVQEALELATWAQKQLGKASQQAELVLEKATQSQEFQLKSRAATAEGSLEVQQQQVWMQQLSNELFNEAASIGDQILAQAESAIGSTKSGVIKVIAACEPLQALAKKHEEATRVLKSQQLAQQAEQRGEQRDLPAVERSRESLQSARDDRDRGVLIIACQQVKMTVAEATSSAALVFQAVHLAQQAAPAIRMATGDGGTDGSGFYSFSTKAVVSTTTKPLPGPEREAMPIDEHRDEIVRAIRERRVTCIQGETGCGKSSRVPQYVFHLCRQAPKRPGDEKIIVCTQPRRLAALTLSQRVAKEMGDISIGALVGFRVSGESIYDVRKTRLLFVTTGYLLQVLVNDPGQIHKYSHIILDEAHERSVDADLLSLVLKLHIQHKLADFKLIIMSATLQGGIFSRYFQDEGDRTSPTAPIFVGVKRYQLDILYLEDLPALKSRMDANDLAATTMEELRERSGLCFTGAALEGLNSALDTFRLAGAPRRAAAEHGRINSDEPSTSHVVKPELAKGLPQVLLELVRMLGCGGEGVLIFLPGMHEMSELYEVLEVLEHAEAPGLPTRKSSCEFKIFMLHSTIPMDEQEQAFQTPTENVCHIFLASSMAESSLTLPKVRVAIDTCLRRQMAPKQGVNCLLTQWASHASAAQRAGRAGRVFPGVAIRLVPRSFYTQHMAQYDAAEIEQAALEKLYLNVKQLSTRLRERLPRAGALPPRRLLQLTVQPPPMERLEEAVRNLAEMGALTTTREESAGITVLGRMAIALPLDLRLCRLILFGVLFGCGADAVVMATALSGQDPFSTPTSIVLKDHMKYARAVVRSWESRCHFDAGALSEPIMLRNLFKAWLKGLGQESEAMGGRRFTSGASQRHLFVKHAHEFAKNHAVMPKRLTQLALTVVDVAQRTLDFLAPNEDPEKLASPARVSLEALLLSMGIQASSDGVEPPSISEIFCEDQLLLKTTLTAAFAPRFAHGIPRCLDYTSIGGPKRFDKAQKVITTTSDVATIKADAELAKVHSQALARSDVIEPKAFFCIPQVPDALAMQPATDMWSLSMRELLNAGGPLFKKLQVSQGQAFVTYEHQLDSDVASEESVDEEIRPPETLVQQVQEQLQLPAMEDFSGDERRQKRRPPSSESEKRKRRREVEEQQERPPVAEASADQGLRPSSGEWQWSTAALTRDESDEAERDEEKDRKKDKRRKKKKEDSSDSESESSSRRRRKKKKKEAKRKKKSKKRKENAWEVASSSSGDLEIVAESQSMLALPNSESADATLDSAFEEVTEEQREKQRRRLERFRAMQAGLEDEDDGKGKKLELKGAEGDSILAKLKAQATEGADKAEESSEEESAADADEAAGKEEVLPPSAPSTKPGEPQEAPEEEEGSPVDVNEEDVRWERKLVPKAEGKRRGVQFGGPPKEGDAAESDTELFQDLKNQKEEEPKASSPEGEVKPKEESDTELFQDLKQKDTPEEDFANFLDEIKELDALSTPGAEVEALLQPDPPQVPPVGLTFKEPRKLLQDLEPEEPQAAKEAKEEEEVKEEVKEDVVKEEPKEEVKEDDLGQECKEEVKEEVKEELKEEAPEEKDEMDAFLDGIEDMEDKDKAEVTEVKKADDPEVPEAGSTEAPNPPQEEEKALEPQLEASSVQPEPAGEDEEMAAFLNCLEAEATKEDVEMSDGKDDSTAPTDGTPRAMTEGAEDDFAAFLGALDEMEEKAQAQTEAEETDGLDDLPVVEIKRRLRAAGASIPSGPEDKEELVALLRETLNKPKDDAFQDFLSEIDQMQPEAADTEMKDSAFESFLKEIDGMPVAEVEPPVEPPLRLHYVLDRRAWVVLVKGREVKDFPDARPITARREALQFCYQKLKELETELDGKEKEELEKLTREVMVRPHRLSLCRGLEFPSMHLLVQFGNGKSSFQWPVRVRQSFAGSRQAQGQSFSSELEQKFEIHRPLHPFQLAWRVSLDRSDGCFGQGSFRSPAGLVVSCPSRSAFQRLQKSQAKHAMEAAVAQGKVHSEQQRHGKLIPAASSSQEAKALKQRMEEETKVLLAEVAKAELQLYTRCARRLERLAVFSSAQGREERGVELEGLTVLPNEDGSNLMPVLLLLAFLRPRTCGGRAPGGCAALCDLDHLHVRAISIFGHSEDSRWVLPITGKRRLSLQDLRYVNDLRRAVSQAFTCDEEGQDLKKKPAPSRMVIKETPETTRALGLLLSERSPFDEDFVSEEVSEKPRFLGDVWIDLSEEGAEDEAAWEPDHGFVRWDAPLKGSGSQVFLSFEDLGKQGAEQAPKPAPKAESTSVIEEKPFAFLPELSLSQALKERAESFRSMQSEVRTILSCGKEVRAAKERVKHLRRITKMLDGFQDRSRSAWTSAMRAEEPYSVKQAMGVATRILQDLSSSFTEIEAGAAFVRELHEKSESRKQRAEASNAMAPHIWASAVQAARLMHEKMAFHWRLASAMLKHADASKRSSYKKADDTIRLVNEKLLRWKEEAEILQQEAREDEMARQASLRQQSVAPKAKVEAKEVARQRQDLERQRQARQWGRHLMQAPPLEPEKLRRPPIDVPPPPPGQPHWVLQPPGPPP